MKSYARNQGRQIGAAVIAQDIASNETETVSDDTVHSYIEA